MSKIHITKTKVLNESVEVNYYEIEQDGSKTVTTKTHDASPHADLVKVFGLLAVHVALINEFIPSEEIGDVEKPKHDKLKYFSVKGFSVKGDEKDQSVVIEAMKELSNGKMFGFNTVSIRLNDESQQAYDFRDELKKVIETCKDEVREYLNGKHGPKAQTEIEFPEHSDNGKPEMKAVKGGKVKKKKSDEVVEEAN